MTDPFSVYDSTWNGDAKLKNKNFEVEEELTANIIKSTDPSSVDLFIQNVPFKDGKVDGVDVSALELSVNTNTSTINTYPSNLDDLSDTNVSHLTSLDQNLHSTANTTFNTVTLATNPTLNYHVTTKAYVDSLAQGVRDWQESVLKRVTLESEIDEPGRYIILDVVALANFTVNSSIQIISNGAITTGDSNTTFENGNIVEIFGTLGSFRVDMKLIPNTGAATMVESETKIYFYSFNVALQLETWMSMGSIFNHDSLIGAGVNTHSDIDTHIDSVVNPHEVSLNQVVSKMHTDNSTSAVKGDLYVYDGSKNIKLAAANNSQVLVSDSTTSTGWNLLNFNDLFLEYYAYSGASVVLPATNTWSDFTLSNQLSTSSTDFTLSSGSITINKVGRYNVSYNFVMHMPTESVASQTEHLIGIRIYNETSGAVVPTSNTMGYLRGNIVGAETVSFNFTMDTTVVDTVVKMQTRFLRGQGIVNTLFEGVNIKISKVPIYLSKL